MAVCTIIGHSELFDADLEERIEKAIAAIARQNDEIDFWFHNAHGIARTVFVAAIRAKARYPKKKITITLVDSGVRQSDMPHRNLFLGWSFPACAFDRLLVPPYASELQSLLEAPLDDMDHAQMHRVRKKIERWMLQQSDYCLCYTYRELMESTTSLYQYALRLKTLRMLNLTNPDTTAFFRERVARFPADEYDVFRYWDQGESLKSIGARYGITGTAVERRLKHTRKKLRGLGENRLLKASRERGCKRCGIVGVGAGTQEENSTLQNTLAYLHRNHGVKEFWVKDEFLSSEYFETLTYQLLRWQDSKLVIVTAQQDNEETLKENLRHRMMVRYCDVRYFEPECKSLRARNLRTIKHIMDSTDFCAFSSVGKSAFHDSIVLHIRGKQPKVAFDIGNADISVERAEEKDAGLG